MQFDLFAEGAPLPASTGRAEEPTHSIAVAPRQLPFRRNAPRGTSECAAALAAPRAATQRERVLAFIRERGPLGATDDEGEAALGMLAQSYTARRNGLVRDGLIRDSHARRLTRSGCPAAVWVAREVTIHEA